MVDHYDPLLRGLTQQPMQSQDRFFTNKITNLLFPNANGMGQDLESFDINRGLDHGSCTYVDALKFFFNKDVKSFDDLNSHINDTKVSYKRT